MKRLLALLTLVAALSSLTMAKTMKGSWTGWISDAKCGAKVDPDCAKKCVEGGQMAVFVTDDKKDVLQIHNQEAVKGHAGHHVKLTGSIDKGSIHVDKIEMLPDQNMNMNMNNMGDNK